MSISHAVPAAINYCSVIMNKSFDPVACVATHLPWWIEPLAWVVAILLILTAVQNTLWLFKLLFEPGLELIKNSVVGLTQWIKEKAGQ